MAEFVQLIARWTQRSIQTGVIQGVNWVKAHAQEPRLTPGHGTTAMIRHWIRSRWRCSIFEGIRTNSLFVQTAYSTYRRSSQFWPNIRCVIKHCPLTYSNFGSFRSHVNRHELEEELSAEPETQPIDVAQQGLSNSTNSEDENGDGLDGQDSEDTVNSAPDMAEEQICFEGQYCIPQSNLNSLLEDVSALYSSLDNIKKACVVNYK